MKAKKIKNYHSLSAIVDKKNVVSSPETIGLNITIKSLRGSGFAQDSKEVKALLSLIDNLKK